MYVMSNIPVYIFPMLHRHKVIYICYIWIISLIIKMVIRTANKSKQSRINFKFFSSPVLI